MVRCIGCNACIAHYHAETPIRCAHEPAHGARADAAARRPRDGAPRRVVVVVGAGPAGLAAAAEAGAAGDEVDRARARRRGSAARPGSSAPRPATRRRRGPWSPTTRCCSTARTSSCASAPRPTPTTIAALGPDLVVVATGARPYAAAPDLGDVPVAQRLGRPRRRAARAAASWSPTGAASRPASTAPSCSPRRAARSPSSPPPPMPGFSVHQYARHQYLARLERAGVTIAYRPGARLRRPAARSAAAASSRPSARGRSRPTPSSPRSAASPRTRLAERCAPPASRIESAGDCRSPRGLEEAILEGTLAVRPPADSF